VCSREEITPIVGLGAWIDRLSRLHRQQRVQRNDGSIRIIRAEIADVAVANSVRLA
jgi:hypothetical protein